MHLPTPFPSARILVAEDDPVQAALICDLLQKEGYRVESRTTMSETREAVRAGIPDLLLLDRMFPEGDGCLLCQELKASPVTQGLPIIMLTARDRVEDRVEGLLRGAEDYTPKPFHPREFLARVHSCLRTLVLQREIKQQAEELARKNQMLVETQERLIRSERLAAIGEIGLAMATLEAIAEPARPIRLPGTAMCSDVDGVKGKMDVAVGLPDRSSPCQIDSIA